VDWVLVGMYTGGRASRGVGSSTLRSPIRSHDFNCVILSQGTSADLQ
jgi:hypothetical protein